MSAGLDLGFVPVRLRARRRIVGLGIMATLAVAVCALVSVPPLLSGQSAGRKVTKDNLAIHQIVDLRSKLATWQLFAEPLFATFSPAPAKLDPTTIGKASELANSVGAQVTASASALDGLGLRAAASGLRSDYAAFQKAATAFGPLVAGQPLAVITATITEERSTFTRIWDRASAAGDSMRQIAAADLHDNDVYLGRARVIVLAVDAAFAAIALGAAVIVGQRARRTERARGEARQRRTFETVLQDALEMATTETDAYALMAKALASSVPQLQSEMLVADSSRAHFRRALSTVSDTDPDKRAGCDVVSPMECPATIRGHTLRFATSRALNACPYLQNRLTGDCSAVCVPISISGKTVGVVHATGPDQTQLSDIDADREVRYLEITSRRVSERVAMLRAFEKSESQARSDPLTGLLNRRSLENRVHTLQRDGTPYAIAYGDLDHFKVLNDTHGHEAGDQALRLFAWVMRDSVRPDDIVSRYGGEEFVIVFPNCLADDAVAILERLRERLALALTAGHVPSFTASFGVSQSNPLKTFDEIVATADDALLAAKAAGRNRVNLADEYHTDDLNESQTTQPRPVP